jgi:hypothetical protein
MSKRGIARAAMDRRMVLQEPVSGSAMSNNEHTFADRNRHLVEVPDSFAIARWPRDADVATIARCILATLKYEPHAVDTSVLRRALEGVIEHTTRAGISQKQEETKTMMDEKRTVDQSEMPPSLPDVQADQMTVKQWLAIRKEAGLKIDPETAEVTWDYAQTFDPYGVFPDLPEEYQQVGREYFARAPGNDVWVHFGDLPKATREALWKKHSSKLAFPAGLEWVRFEEKEEQS